MGIKQIFRSRRNADEFEEKSGSNNEFPAVIALTGSTGNFGSYILDLLLQNPSVSKIYCLNRSENAKLRQQKQHEARGLSMQFDSHRVEFWKVNFGAERWGMNEAMQHILAEEIEVIIHNAWPVDFNRNFQSFSAQVDGIRQLINITSERPLLSNHSRSEMLPENASDKDAKDSLDKDASATSTRGPTRIFFISSIGTVSNWASQAPTSRESVPEDELTDWKLARTGYGQSKLLSERLLAHAARTLHIPVDIARIGQLGGPVKHGVHGAWPPQEWLPSLIESSQTMKTLPKTLGPSDTVDWVPVDIAAQVVVDLLQPCATTRSVQRYKTEPRFFHVVNPRRVSWATLLPTIRAHMPREFEEVSIEDWVNRLKSCQTVKGSSLSSEAANPALKLIDMFDHIQDRAIRFPDARSAVLDTKKTVMASTTLADLQAVHGKWMDLWMTQWASR